MLGVPADADQGLFQLKLLSGADAPVLGKGPMTIKIYAINLDRSVDRWNALSRQAQELNLDLIRVPGVDGTIIPPEERVDTDEYFFRRNNGRIFLPGEYGCYRSHLKALSIFLSTGDPLAIIVEDDIQLRSDLVAQADAAFQALPQADVIKLLNHRIVWFKRFATSSLGIDIGRAAHGPQGSTACYAVTRLGAEKLVKRLARMEYPWDIALERGWATGIEIYTTRLNMVSIVRHKTTIASRSAYRASKFPWWRRLRTYHVRMLESVRRIDYALRG